MLFRLVRVFYSETTSALCALWWIQRVSTTLKRVSNGNAKHYSRNDRTKINRLLFVEYYQPSEDLCFRTLGSIAILLSSPACKRRFSKFGFSTGSLNGPVLKLRSFCVRHAVEHLLVLIYTSIWGPL